MKWGIAQIAAAAVLLAAAITPAIATTITVESGGIVLNSTDTTKVGSEGDPWLISETMTSAGTLQFSDLGGDNDTGSLHVFGKWISKSVTNSTSVDWTSFELELQLILGTASEDGDGLSFAQGAGFVFTSDLFSTVTAIEDIRDYLNFHDGLVAIGQTVTFNIAITDLLDRSFYLLQTPNIREQVDVPEPGTLALIGAGLAGLAVLRRRRKAKA
jgi:hypothetical protein